MRGEARGEKEGEIHWKKDLGDKNWNIWVLGIRNASFPPLCFTNLATNLSEPHLQPHLSCLRAFANEIPSAQNALPSDICVAFLLLPVSDQLSIPLRDCP